jgi:pimeloyl-ACP methyl ester carboxylesterase
MSTLTETPGFLTGPDGPLFCVDSRPPNPATRGVVLAGGGWMGSSTNRNGVLVRMSRAVGEIGVRAARFDWRGTGESGGTVERFDLEAPFHDDVATVIRYLVDTGCTSVTVFGICFGAWSSLLAADDHEQVDHVILLSLPFPSEKTKADHKTDRIALDSAMRMAWRPAVWVTLLKNPAMRQAIVRGLRRKILKRSDAGKTIPKATTSAAVPVVLERLAARKVTIDLIFGEKDLEFASYQAFTAHTPLPAGIRVTCIPGDLSNFGTLAAQEAAVDAVVKALVR